jgi:prepilin-type N-terminal cleavage/methylation domain-containing protein
MRNRPRRGFTLTEILIAMTLMSIIILSVVGMLLSQTRFASRVSGDISTLDRINPVTEMLNTELASLPPGAVTTATATEIAFRLPLSWGVICGPLDRHTKSAGGKKKGKAPIVYSTTTAMALEPLASALGSPLPTGFALSVNGTLFTYYDVAWSSLGMTQATTANPTAGQACLDRTPLQPAGKSGNFRSAKSAKVLSASQIGNLDDYWQSTAMASQVGGTVPAERTLIVTYQLVRYYFSAEGTGRVALFRHTAAGGEQRLAGPYSSQAGFTYRLNDATEGTSVTAANLTRLRAVRLNLPAQRVQRGAVAAATRTVQPWLYLVNVQ